MRDRGDSTLYIIDKKATEVADRYFSNLGIRVVGINGDFGSRRVLDQFSSELNFEPRGGR